MTMRREQHSMKNRLQLLVVGDKTRFIHLEQFATELERIGIESKLIYDIEFVDKFFLYKYPRYQTLLKSNLKKRIKK